MNRKLTEWRVARIRALLGRGETQEKVAAAFDVGLMTVNDIANNRTWVGVAPEIEDPILQTVHSSDFLSVKWGRTFLCKLICRWVASRASADASSSLTFDYSPLVLFDTKRVREKASGKSRVIGVPRFDGSTTYFSPRRDGISDTATVRAGKLRNIVRPLPSNALCWALTFEIVLRDTLYTSERWAIARWHKDERNVMPFPQRAAEKLVRECRRRGLIY